MSALWLEQKSPVIVDKFLDECERDTIFLYEPQETFTYNHRFKERDLGSIRSPKEFQKYVASKNIPVCGVKRGGGMMWHGPGQIVLAPAINIRKHKLGISEYASFLEETCIQALARFGVKAERNRYRYGAQGVWVEDETGKKKKIAFYAFRVAREIARNGCAINVAPDPYPFSLVNPCNLPEIETTSIRQITGSSPDMKEIAKVLLETFLQNLKNKTAPAFCA